MFFFQTEFFISRLFRTNLMAWTIFPLHKISTFVIQIKEDLSTFMKHRSFSIRVNQIFVSVLNINKMSISEIVEIFIYFQKSMAFNETFRFIRGQVGSIVILTQTSFIFNIKTRSYIN